MSLFEVNVSGRRIKGRNGRSKHSFTSLIAAAALTCGLAWLPTNEANAAGVELLGINLAGAEFTSGILPGKEGTNYFFPTEANFQQWTSKGIRLIRFPILWERLQPVLNGPFDATYAGYIDQTFALADKYNVQLVLDVHNYMRYRNEVIGTGKVSYASYRDLIRKIALRWSSKKSLYAYDIMNEPHDADAQWPIAAQHGIDAIREIDRVKPIMIEGNAWASAANWPWWNKSLLNLKDPADNLIFQAHLYFDGNDGGSYKKFDVTTVNANYGVERVKPFVQWLKDNNKKGFIGEFGVPGDDPRWFPIMEGMLAYLKENCIPATYWAAGRSWGNYRLAIEPKNGADRPQWSVLKKYIDNTSCSAIGPKSTAATPKPAPAPAPVQTVAPTMPAKPALEETTATINNFTDKNWEKGVYRTAAGVSIPATSNNIKAFTAGQGVVLSDGKVVNIRHVQIVGNNMSVFFDTGTLDGKKLGYPNTLKLATATNTGKPASPQPSSGSNNSNTTKPSSGSNTNTGNNPATTTPVKTPAPAPKPATKTVEAPINNFTDKNWDKGIAKNMAGFSIPKTTANVNAFKVGSSVKMANGQVYQVGSVYSVGNNMSVYLNGPKLKGSAVGHPRTVTLFAGAK
ncbi:cellulase family glycosylhydrolase [Pseudomonas sp. Marseille-QA0892]